MGFALCIMGRHCYCMSHSPAAEKVDNWTSCWSVYSHYQSKTRWNRTTKTWHSCL